MKEITLTSHDGTYYTCPAGFVYQMEEEGTLIALKAAGAATILELAAKVVVEHSYASPSLLQRRLKVSYVAAVDIIDNLAAAGVIGQFTGSIQRELLVSNTEEALSLLKKNKSHG